MYPGLKTLLPLGLALALAQGFLSCTPAPPTAPEATPKATGPAAPQTKTLVVTYAILGSLVQELAGGQFRVESLIPSGLDPHEWEPSARDIERLDRADLVIENGLGLEGGLGKALAQARAAGRPFFTASDHVAVRHVGAGEGLPGGDRDQKLGAADPHLWTDPLAMKAVVAALAAELQSRFGPSLADGGSGLGRRAAELETRLDRLDAEIRGELAALPPGRRKLVTGHESLGYFAQRYNLRLVGAVVPSLSSEAESSASDLAALKTLIAAEGVTVLFTELGTPPATVHALAAEAGVRALPLSTHALPPDGSYFSFERTLAAQIVAGLR